MQPLTHVDLFSGIGGFALAARWAGFETKCFSEIDTYASAVLRKHWPDVPNLGDITKADFSPYAGATLLTGGFPCQPFSVAGKQRGKEDDRFLWPAMLAAIAAVKPTYIVGENVAGIIRMELDRVLADLEGQGYSALPLVIPACAVDARHRRDRVWIVAHANGSERRPRELGAGSPKQRPDGERREETGVPGIGGEVLADSESLGRGEVRGRTSGQSGHADECSEDASTFECIAYFDNGTQAYKCRICGAISDTASEKCERCRPREQAGRGQSSDPCRWPAEPGVGRVAHGIPRRVDRIKGLGNAIVPQVAFEILKAIAASVEANH